ncbi:MAG TPA: hypothetical protein VIH04_01140 [Nitrosarchaeum sp.]
MLEPFFAENQPDLEDDLTPRENSAHQYKTSEPFMNIIFTSRINEASVAVRFWRK